MKTYESTLPIAPEEGLYLREIAISDASAVHAFVSEPDNNQHLSTFQPWAKRATVSSITMDIVDRLDDIRRGNSLHYRIMQGDEMAGAVTLYGREERTTNLSYYVGKAFLGCNYAARAAQTLLEYTADADVWGTNKVQLWINDKNEPSKAVARKLGAVPTDWFSDDGIFVLPGYETEILRVWEKQL